MLEPMQKPVCAAPADDDTPDATTEHYWLTVAAKLTELRDRIQQDVRDSFVDELAQDNAIALLDHLDQALMSANANARRMELFGWEQE